MLLSGNHARIDGLAARAEPRAERRVSDVDERPEGGEEPSRRIPPAAQPAWAASRRGGQPRSCLRPGAPPTAATATRRADGRPTQAPRSCAAAGRAMAPLGSAAPTGTPAATRSPTRRPLHRPTTIRRTGSRATRSTASRAACRTASASRSTGSSRSSARSRSCCSSRRSSSTRTGSRRRRWSRRCTAPGPRVGCEARFSDRVLANRFLYHLRDPRRGEIIVFKTPPGAQLKCGAGGTFVKRLIGLPGETVEVRLRQGDGYVYINGKPLQGAVHRAVAPRRRAGASGRSRCPPGHYFMMGDNRSQSCDSRDVGHRAAREPDRQGLRDLLAAEPSVACTRRPPAAAAGIARSAGRSTPRLSRVPLHSAPGRRPTLSHEHDHPEHRAGAAARGPRLQGRATPCASTSR